MERGPQRQLPARSLPDPYPLVNRNTAFFLESATLLFRQTLALPMSPLLTSTGSRARLRIESGHSWPLALTTPATTLALAAAAQPFATVALAAATEPFAAAALAAAAKPFAAASLAAASLAAVAAAGEKLRRPRRQEASQLQEANQASQLQADMVCQ